MKRWLSFVLIGSFALAAGSAAADTKAVPWGAYGAKITLEKPSHLRLAKKPVIGKEMLIQGTVADVCQAKGCWMTIKDGKDEVRVEFEDYGFFVPWDAAGKRVRMQGVLTEKVQSPEEQAHIAAESKAGDEPSTQPKKVFVFIASGVAIEAGGPLSPEQKARIDKSAQRESEKNEANADTSNDEGP